LGEALEHRLEVGDREWKRWCEWLSEWWQRVGDKDWQRIEAAAAGGVGVAGVAAAAGVDMKPQAIVAPVPVKKAHHAAVQAVAATGVQTHPARTMSLDGMIGWSANVKKRMSQMAEYEWDKEAASDVECSDYDEEDEDAVQDDGMEGDDDDDEEWCESDAEYEAKTAAVSAAPTAMAHKPILRKKDSGYCGISPSTVSAKRAAPEGDDAEEMLLSDDEVNEIQVEASAATRYAVKRATMSFKWKWSMFN